MKYISYLSLAILATALMGCDEIEESNSLPITNPQQPLVQVNNVKVIASEAIANGNTVNLQEMSDNGIERLLVYTIEDSGAELPEGSMVFGNFEISADEDFTSPVTFVRITDEELKAYVTLEQLQEARSSMFGKTPDLRTVFYRIAVYAQYEGAVYQLYKDSPYMLSGSFEEKGLDSDYVAPPAWVGTPNDTQGWNIATSQHLPLGAGDTFSGFAYAGGEWGMKLAYVKDDGKEVWIGLDGDLTFVENNGDSYYEGTMILDGGGNIFENTTPKLYWIDFNWDSLKITLREVSTAGAVGEFNSWDAAGSTALTAEPDSNFLVWTGTLDLAADSQWKFCFNGGWTVNLGASGDIEPVEVKVGETLDGLVLNGKNFLTPAGIYKVKLDLTTLPYSFTIVAE